MNIYDRVMDSKPIESVLNVQGLSKVILYGAGRLGKKLYTELCSFGVEVVAFIDKNASELSFACAICTLSEAEDKLDKNTPVIISISLSKKDDELVRLQLQQAGFQFIYSLYELDWNNLYDTDFGKTVFIGDYDINNLEKDINDISYAYELLHDSYDKDYFIKYIAAYYHKNYVALSCPEYGPEMQYAGDEFAAKIDFSRFIDCGAYDGDALRHLLSKGKEIEAYLAFEPQMDLCEKILEMRDKVDVHDITVLPCGVGDKIEQNFWGGEAKLSARVSKSGNQIIQCMTIDAIGDIFKPTFIKMDIEGMEPYALKGAERIIKKYRPSLAICVYHDLAHLWQIPKMISEMDSNYKFYLRHYWIMGLETVLYAIP